MLVVRLLMNVNKELLVLVDIWKYNEDGGKMDNQYMLVIIIQHYM